MMCPWFDSTLRDITSFPGKKKKKKKKCLRVRLTLSVKSDTLGKRTEFNPWQAAISTQNVSNAGGLSLRITEVSTIYSQGINLE